MYFSPLKEHLASQMLLLLITYRNICLSVLSKGFGAFFGSPHKPGNMTIVLLIFLSIGRQKSTEKQWAFLMTGSECAGLDVSESAAVSQSRETAGEAQQHNDTADIYAFLE